MSIWKKDGKVREEGSTVYINGEPYMNPYLKLDHIWEGSHVWLWNEFVKNPEALAEYFEEGRYPEGVWENKEGKWFDYQVRNDFYLRLDFAKRALEIAYDSSLVYRDMKEWFLKFWRAYKEPFEKVYPQFDDRNYANPTILERIADWCALTVANTFVKYGPNAFFVLLKSILTNVNLDNEWMEAIKHYVTKEFPELANYDFFKRISEKELPLSDELYIELKNIFQKWIQKYKPKDEMTYVRLDLMDLFEDTLKNKNYYFANHPFYNELTENLTNEFIIPSITKDFNMPFKEFWWAMEYLNYPNLHIAPPGWDSSMSHVTWDYMKFKHKPKTNYSYGV